MIARFLIPGIVALLPATAMAQGLTDTHELISVPGKAIHAYRPIERDNSPAIKCHPDGTKAIACEAMLQKGRAEQLAQKREAEAVRLGSR